MNELVTYGGVTLMVILTNTGSLIGAAITGNATIEFMKKNPDALGQYIGFSALSSSQGLYGFAGFFMTNGLVKDLLTADVFGAGVAWAISTAGLSLDLVGLYSAIRQVQVCANNIRDISAGSSPFGVTMIMAVFPELYAILALLVSILTFGVVRGLFFTA